MRWRWLLLPTLFVPATLEIACSASNGASIGSEIRDAEALDASTGDPADRDSSFTTDDADVPNPPKDGAAKDTSTDAPVDAAVTSASVRINEIYVNRGAGGDQQEFIELSGAPGTAIDDLFVRALDGAGAPTGEWAITPATKIGATGTWTLGGGTASGRIDQTIPAFDDWGLVTAKGAVQLLRGPTKQVIDAVSWNTDGDGGTVMGEGKPFTLAPTGTDSFGRKPPSFGDTNDNRADFCAMNQSAGATNGACK
jgi:hypothetical protein